MESATMSRVGNPADGKEPHMRRRNHGVRKRCRCKPKQWPKCPHTWHLNYKPKGGSHHRLSLDTELGRHIDSRSEAESEATKIRAAIVAGTFRVASLAARKLSTMENRRHLNLLHARQRFR
jgi:hypothetical protein